MTEKVRELTVDIHSEGGAYWAEVRELPGCFATGDTLEELNESLIEAIGLYLAEDDEPVSVRLEEPEPVEVRGTLVQHQRIAIAG